MRYEWPPVQDGVGAAISHPSPVSRGTDSWQGSRVSDSRRPIIQSLDKNFQGLAVVACALLTPRSGTWREEKVTPGMTHCRTRQGLQATIFKPIRRKYKMHCT